MMIVCHQDIYISGFFFSDRVDAWGEDALYICCWLENKKLGTVPLYETCSQTVRKSQCGVCRAGTMHMYTSAQRCAEVVPNFVKFSHTKVTHQGICRLLLMGLHAF